MATISDKMRTLAATHHRAAELTTLADKLDAAQKGYFAEPQTVSVQNFMGAYARAKRVWCECSGEPLVSEAVVHAGANLLSALSALRGA